MLAEVRVGPQTAGDGSVLVGRAAKTGELAVTDAHGRYYEAAARNQVYFAANQAVATTTVGLNATYTGLAVSNPVNSPVNLALLACSFNQSVIQSTQPEAFGLAFGSNATTNVTHTAAITPVNARIGNGSSGYGKADSSATLPTAPVYGFFIGNTASATVLGAGGGYDLAGQFVLAPGGYVCFVTPAQASVAGMWFSLTWEEVPV